MNVFVVEQGERCEGSTIMGITLSLESAKKIAEDLFNSWHWYDKKQEDQFNWTGGCDYISITEMEVTE